MAKIEPLDGWEKCGSCLSRDEDGSLWEHVSYRRAVGASGDYEVRTEDVLIEEPATEA